MSNPENGSFYYMSEIDTFLPAAAAAAAAALRAENRPCLVKVLEDKLQNLAVKYAEAMERKRMETFKESLRAYVKLEAKFVEERAALEAKYQKLYEPLYTKRFEIVNGVVEVEGLTESLTDQGDAEADVVKGIPDFWLNAFKNNVILAEEITERDEEALKYLKNIEWSRIDDPEAFKLEFFFDTNPFFKNSLLTKTYHMIDEDEPRVEKAIGTQIEWIKGKCLTQKVTKKKPKKGAKNAKPITKTEDCESFFHFFSPPEVPEYGDDMTSMRMSIMSEQAEDLQNLMDQDYDIGSTIRDEIIPHAVSWFTGEAVEEIDLTDDDDDEDIIEEDEDEEEYGDEESK